MPPASRNLLQASSLHASRWITGSLSLGAGLATILASAHSCGLIGDASASRRTLLDIGVHSIAIMPANDTLAALGDSLQLAATITDQRGASLVGTSLEWRSENPKVATVDSSGLVVAQAPGATHIVARVGEKTARAQLLVAPRMARLDLVDTLLPLGEGRSRMVAVRALDARGYPAPMVPLTWISSDTTIMVVNDSGLVTAAGPGRADLTAMHAGVIATLPVVVTAVPGRLLVIDGNSQVAEAGARLATPVRVLLESRRGRPMAGVSVHFVPERGGVADPAYATTNAEGVALSNWTLGSSPGPQRLLAQATDLDSGAVLVAEADPLVINTKVTPVGYPWSGRAGASTPIRVSVQLTDSAGRLLPGVPVTWVALDSGSIRSLNARTDSLGVSHAEWRLARRSGIQRARVRVGTGQNMPVAPLLVTALAGAPATLVASERNPQRGRAGDPLGKPIAVLLHDASGNPVAGASVTAEATAGRLADSLAVTDSLGIATFRWTLGTKAGRQQLLVRSGTLPPVSASILAMPGTPAAIDFISSPMSSTAGKPLPRPVRLVITDAYGNRVTDRQVTFTVTGGATSPARVMPSPDGMVTTKWRLGTRKGKQWLTAEVRGTAVRGKLEAVAK